MSNKEIVRLAKYCEKREYKVKLLWKLLEKGFFLLNVLNLPDSDLNLCMAGANRSCKQEFMFIREAATTF